MAQYEALIAAGRAHLWAGRLADGQAAFEAAIWLRPDAAAARYLHGEALFLQRRLAEALDSHAAATACGTEADDRGAGMSGLVPGDFAWMAHMLRGEFESAWRLADHDREQRRRRGITGAGWPRHMRPVWDGGALAGRHVLVRCHHGLGDTIQFIRYVPRVAAEAASVSVEAQPGLLPLLREVPGIASLHPLGESEERPCAAFGCDAEIDVTELPHACRTTLDKIPVVVPYLHAEPARRAEAVRRLAPLGGALKVGLVWAAGEWKPERSIALSRLAPLADIPGLALVNLQRGPEYVRWRQRGNGGDVLPLTDLFPSDEIADAAAGVAALDLVVTVDTMAAHLAGALGVPVWLMLHFAADWRWLVERSDSPWYPTMRLFRQPHPGDWEPVVAEIAASLRRRAGG